MIVFFAFFIVLNSMTTNILCWEVFKVLEAWYIRILSFKFLHKWTII